MVVSLRSHASILLLGELSKSAFAQTRSFKFLSIQEKDERDIGLASFTLKRTFERTAANDGCPPFTPKTLAKDLDSSVISTEHLWHRKHRSD